MLAFFLQLSKPEKVVIPERYVELEPEEPLSTEELAARQRKAEKIKNILTKSRLGFRVFSKPYTGAHVKHGELATYNNLYFCYMGVTGSCEEMHTEFMCFLEQGKRHNAEFCICPFSCLESPKTVVSPY